MNREIIKWIDFWDRKNAFMEANMKKNAQIFIKNYPKIFKFNKSDVVLDVGCGPGYLEEYLKDKVKEIHCLEISAYYINLLKNKFEGSSNVYIHKLDKRKYLNLDSLMPRKF